LGFELARAGLANFFWDDRLLARGGLDHLGISCRIVALNLSAKRRLCNTVGVPLRAAPQIAAPYLAHALAPRPTIRVCSRVQRRKRPRRSYSATKSPGSRILKLSI
jgi:hypothetical protein